VGRKKLPNKYIHTYIQQYITRNIVKHVARNICVLLSFSENFRDRLDSVIQLCLEFRPCKKAIIRPLGLFSAKLCFTILQIFTLPQLQFQASQKSFVVRRAKGHGVIDMCLIMPTYCKTQAANTTTPVGLYNFNFPEWR